MGQAVPGGHRWTRGSPPRPGTTNRAIRRLNYVMKYTVLIYLSPEELANRANPDYFAPYAAYAQAT